MDTFGRAQRVPHKGKEGGGGAPETYVNKKTDAVLKECKAYTVQNALSLNGSVFDAKKKRITNVGDVLRTTDALTLFSLTNRVPMFKREDRKLVVDMKGARMHTVAVPLEPQDAVNKAYADGMLPLDYRKSGVLGVRKRRIIDVANPQDPQDACTKVYVDNMMTKTSPINVSQIGVMKVGKRRIAEVLPPENEDEVCTKKYVDDKFLTKILTVDTKQHPETVQVYNRRLINLAEPTDAQDAVTMSYLQRALVTALGAVSPACLLTIESLYPHPPFNASLPGKWYMLPTGRNKFPIPCDGTLTLVNASPLLIYLHVYVDVVNFKKLPPPLNLQMDTPFRVKKGQTFAFQLHDAPDSAHIDDFHLYLLFVYRMELPIVTPVASRAF